MALLFVLFACAPEDAPGGGGTVPPVDTDTDTDTFDTDTGTPAVNEAPGAPEVAIEPAVPAAGNDFSVVIVTEAPDPDGDAVTYRYAWTLDGADAGIDTADVSGSDTADAQVWAVSVVASDGELDGPEATDQVVIGNAPPSAAGVALDPEQPVDDETITLIIDPAGIDPEGDTVTTTVTWIQNGDEMVVLADLLEVDRIWVQDGDVFEAIVAVSDGQNTPVTTSASVTVGYTCDRLPPTVEEDNTLDYAVAYHGLAFDDDGFLLGYDAANSIMKSTYGVGADLFVPGFSGIEQFDRLADGDFVIADDTNQRLIRLTSSGSATTLATGVGSVYGVTVGPDEKVWIANGGIARVDPDTGDVETVISQPSGWTAHSLNFNLDSTRLYIGSIGRGDLYYVDLDADLEPTTDPAVFAADVGSGWHDGVVVDECGSIWVADYSSRGFYRVELDGTVTSMVARTAELYGHGAMFGNGVGGWRDDTIYQPQPYNDSTVREVVIGFANGDTVRTWNGVAVPW